jgi:hypothetical protein
MSESAQDAELDPQEDEGSGQAETEQRARNMGWRPREEFRGDANRWLPADEFVERGERLLPLLQERSRAADRTITNLQQQIQQQGETLNTMLESTRRAEQAGYRRAMTELHQQRVKAVEMGDTAAFQAVEQAMRELGPPPPEAPKAPPAQGQGQGQGQANNDPVILAWVREHPWFTSDHIANVAMIAAMQQAERMNPNGTVEDHLIEAENAIRRRFPEHFPQARRITNGSGNGEARQARRPLHIQEDTEDEIEEDEPVAQPVRRQAAPVSRSSDSPPARRPGPRSFEAMPPDVRAQYDRQRKMLEGKGEPLTREEFARYYFENEP